MNYLDTIVKSLIILIALFTSDYLYVNVLKTGFKQQMLDMNSTLVLEHVNLPGIIEIATPIGSLNLTDPKEGNIRIQQDPLKRNIIPNILTFVILTFALYYFILNSDNTIEHKVLNGALLGLCIYGVFEMISSTYIKFWNPVVIATHTLWGGLIFGLLTFIMSEINF